MIKVLVPKRISGILHYESPVAVSNSFIKGNVRIGMYSYIGRESEVNNTQIGRYCSIAPKVIIGPFNHPIETFSTSPITFGNSGPFKFSDEAISITEKFDTYSGKKGKVIIGNDVWIGSNAIIMKGVTIGDGAIIAAGAIVTKNVEAYSIVGGVPADFIRFRFEKSVTTILTDTEWWKYDLSKANIADKIDPTDIGGFCKFIKSSKLEIIKSNYKCYSNIIK